MTRLSLFLLLLLLLLLPKVSRFPDTDELQQQSKTDPSCPSSKPRDRSAFGFRPLLIQAPTNHEWR